MRLIFADDLLNRLYGYFDYFNVKTIGADDIARMINNMPTVDTERHGHWIKKRVGYSMVYNCDIIHWICSECGREFEGHQYSPQDMPYCHCGAKMDEVSEDE